LIPILLHCEGELDLLPEMPPAEQRRRQATAHSEIAQAVAAASAICNPHRAAEDAPATGQTTPRQPHAPVAVTKAPRRRSSRTAYAGSAPLTIHL